MKYRNLGHSGLKVSELCLGTMTFGRRTDEAESIRLVNISLEYGINFFDTADGYGNGASEIILGKALKGHRRQAVVASKFFNPMGSGPNDSGMSRVHIMNALEDSLQRLDMDYVDVYYIHHVDTQTPVEEMLRALDDLVHQGKVRWQLDDCGFQLSSKYEYLLRDIHIDDFEAQQRSDLLCYLS